MTESLFPDITHPKKRALLIAISEVGMVTRACQIAKVGRRTHYRWRDNDPAYREAFFVAEQMAGDLMEGEALRRAVEGWEEPVGWYRGEAGGTVRRYSDTLLIFLLKGLRPEKYADRQHVRTESIEHRLDYARLAQTPEGQRVIDAILDNVPVQQALLEYQGDPPLLNDGEDREKSGEEPRAKT